MADSVEGVSPAVQQQFAAARQEWEQQHTSEMLSLAQEWTRRWAERCTGYLTERLLHSSNPGDGLEPREGCPLLVHF